MPELPEAETIKRGLEKTVVGLKVIDVIIHNAKVIRQPSIELFKKGVRGKTVRRVLRRGKALILELSSGQSLVVHLRMTGQLVYPGGGKASRVSFQLGNKKLLDYNDRRILGELRLLDDWRSLPFIKELGPDPYELSPQQFSAMLSKKKTKIKQLLMDQKFIAGIGNLYAAEVLFYAKIHPHRSALSLSEQEKHKLFSAIRHVFDEAIRYGGSSIDQYVQLSGQRGNYVSHHRVYGREGKPCLVCKAAIKRISEGGRSTYFCAKCQK